MYIQILTTTTALLNFLSTSASALSNNPEARAGPVIVSTLIAGTGTQINQDSKLGMKAFADHECGQDGVKNGISINMPWYDIIYDASVRQDNLLSLQLSRTLQPGEQLDLSSYKKGGTDPCEAFQGFFDAYTGPAAGKCLDISKFAAPVACVRSWHY